MIWLPPSCGQESEFHNTMKTTGRIRVQELAIACGLKQTEALTKGTMVFIHNLVFGNIKYHELYYGLCDVCGTYYCHLDKRADHPCQDE